MDQNTMENEQSPIDAIIGRVDSYIADPTQVTPETLKELKMELEDLRSGIEGEEPQESPMPESDDSMSGMMRQRMGGV